VEQESSLPCSQQPATGPYSEPDESSSQPRNLFQIRSDIILPSTHVTSEWSLFPQAFLQIIYV
jgi:hypothetical protein